MSPNLHGPAGAAPAAPERDASSRRSLDLMRIGWVRRLLAHRAFQPAVQAPFVLMFLVLVYSGLFESPSAGGLTVVVTWVVWWAGIVFLVAFFGKIWCTVCPWNAIADWVNRLAFVRRVPRDEMLTAGKPWPSWLRNISLATGLFVVLIWLELLPGLDMVINPRATALLALLMLAFSLAAALVFERSSFCRYGCLVGRVSGLYANFAPFELRARDRTVCRACRTHDCARGNDKGYPCPTFEHLMTMDRNTYCILCTECIKTCPKNNVSLNARPFGADLLRLTRPRSDEAYLSVIMLSMTLFHIITMTPVWAHMERSLRSSVGLHRMAAYSLLMTGILCVPFAVQTLVAWSSRRLAAARDVSTGTAFVYFAYPLLPQALFGHMAHNSEHLFEEGRFLIPALTDPFNRGWDLLGLGTDYVPRSFLSPTAAEVVKLALFAIGFGYAMVCAFKTARMLYGPGRPMALGSLPVVGAVIAYALFQLWILEKPMAVRLGLGG